MGFGIDAYTAGFLTLPVTAVLSCLIQKQFVFRRRSPDPGSRSADHARK